MGRGLKMDEILDLPLALAYTFEHAEFISRGYKCVGVTDEQEVVNEVLKIAQELKQYA